MPAASSSPSHHDHQALTEHPVAVIDFGSQYTQLIVRRVRELGYYSRLYQPEELAAVAGAPAVILSGGPRSVSEPGAPDIDFDQLRGFNVPVLGICYGMQLSNLKWGGEVSPCHTREYGPADLVLNGTDGGPLLAGLPDRSRIWMSHSDTVTRWPDGTRVLGRNEQGIPVALQWADNYFGIQFHPEVSHTEQGRQVLANFLSLATGAPRFEIESLKQELIEQIQTEVDGRAVVCGVSGGVDSTVLAVLLHEAGVDLRPVFVDTGLLRKDEAREVVANFLELGVEIEMVDASAKFMATLAGVDDPEEKRRRIGNLFIDVFFDAVAPIEVLAQGTLYPDVIESATSGSIASKIKTHHNRVDRILELKAAGRVVEPLSELFKDEVRALGHALGIPAHILNRHPFPGPGMAVRVPGEVTPEKLAITRDGDKIFIDMLKESGWYDKIWQAYCALIPVRTVGVKGDERSYEFAVSLRAVISEDAMTADWVELPPDLLRRISNRLLNEVPGINRVLYDISTKPPASIEWE